MNLTAASFVATAISFVAFILAALWYAVPWMKRRPLAVALSVPLWIHAFRIVALQDFSAQRFGFHISDSLVREIVLGDVAGAALALAVAGVGEVEQYPRLEMACGAPEAAVCGLILLGAAIPFLGRSTRLGVARA